MYILVLTSTDAFSIASPIFIHIQVARNDVVICVYFMKEIHLTIFFCEYCSDSHTILPCKVTEDGADITFPFPTDPDDHCESPLQAYAHMQPLLSLLAKTLGSGGDKGLNIYDPYYCNGAVIENLAALGFPSVYNKKEDCYQVWASATSYPSFDVLVTNPPYSADHIEKLVNHIASPKMNGRPWFLLMPEWVHKKDYFLSKTNSRQMQPFYVIPKKRYVYLPPKDYRASKKSDVHKKSSPFNSMWYVWGGTREGNDKLMRHFYNSNACTFPVVDNTQEETTQRMPLSQVCDLARSKSALRDLRRKHSSKKK